MNFAVITGRCHCGGIRLTINAPPERSALCHCADCRRSAGAHSVGWALFPLQAVDIAGLPARYISSGDVEWAFCPNCGTGLSYRSQSRLPDKIDIRTAIFDDQERYPPEVRIQMAEAPSWLHHLERLPKKDKF